MNREVVSFHLGEAKEQLDKLVTDVTSSSDLDEYDLIVDFAHLYSHLNTAWNARNAGEDYWTSLSDRFYPDRLFPRDIEDYLT